MAEKDRLMGVTGFQVTDTRIQIAAQRNAVGVGAATTVAALQDILGINPVE